MSSPRAEAFASILAAWRGQAVQFAVLNGVDGWPRSIGRDVDVFVSREDLERAHALVGQAMAMHGWEYVSPSGPWGRRTVAFRNGSSIEVHLITRLSWRWLTLASEPVALRGADGVETDEWASFAKRVLMPALADDVARLGLLSQPGRREWELSERGIERVSIALDRVFGAGATDELVPLITSRDVRALGAAVRVRALRQLRSAPVRTPASTLGAAAAFVHRRVARYVQRSGLVVVVLADTSECPPAVGDAASRMEVMTGTAMRSLTWCPKGPGAAPSGSPKRRGVAPILDDVTACGRAAVFNTLQLPRLVSHQRVVLFLMDPPTFAAYMRPVRKRFWRNVDVLVAPSVMVPSDWPSRAQAGGLPLRAVLRQSQPHETNVQLLHDRFVEAFLKRYSST